MKNITTNSHYRHLFKAITWRIIASADTLFLSFIITKNIYFSGMISLSEIITKIILYYLHERMWFKLPFPNSTKRHLIKTCSWRFVGTLDTFLLSWIITGNIFAGIEISLFEVITKMVLYYLHERTWHGFKLGIKKN